MTDGRTMRTNDLSPPHLVAPWLLLVGSLFASCGDEPALVARPPPPPPGNEMKPKPKTPPDDVCALELPELSLRQGGRLEIALEPAVMATLTGVFGSAGLELSTRSAGLSVWASYEASAESLIIERVDCDRVTVPVSVKPLEWSVLAAWDPVTEGGPPAREYGAWSVSRWSAQRGVFVVGGFHFRPRQFTASNDLWFFDLESKNWREITDAPGPVAAGARFAEGPEPDSLFFFGGATLAADGSLDTPARLEIFRFGAELMTWASAPHSAEAPGSYTGSFLHDAARNRWLSVCGADTNRLGVHCAVTQYTLDEGWRPLEVEGAAPAGRLGFHYAFDQANDRVIIVAGQSAGNAVYGDTWALELGEEPPRWVQIFVDDPAVRRRNGAYAFDPVGRRLILWGGTADGRTAVPGLSILRLDRGQERWDHVETPSFKPPRASGFAVYDHEEQQLIMGFGNAAAIYTDLYALSL